MGKVFQLWIKTDKNNFFSMDIEVGWDIVGVRIKEVRNMRDQNEKLDNFIFDTPQSMGTFGDIFRNKRVFVEQTLGYYLSNGERIVEIAELLNK